VKLATSFVCVTAFGMLGCADAYTAPLDSASAPSDTVRIVDLSFIPDSLDIQLGAAVAFENDGETHDVLFVGAGAPIDISRGRRWTEIRRFNTAGRVGYLCSIHPTMGGVIHVR
jgi:plastocyanin